MSPTQFVANVIGESLVNAKTNMYFGLTVKYVINGFTFYVSSKKIIPRIAMSVKTVFESFN